MIKKSNYTVPGFKYELFILSSIIAHWPKRLNSSIVVVGLNRSLTTKAQSGLWIVYRKAQTYKLHTVYIDKVWAGLLLSKHSVITELIHSYGKYGRLLGSYLYFNAILVDWYVSCDVLTKAMKSWREYRISIIITVWLTQRCYYSRYMNLDLQSYQL